jgi:hypothetical protein
MPRCSLWAPASVGLPVAWKRPVLIWSSMMVRKLAEVPEVVEDCLSCHRLLEEAFGLLPPTPSPGKVQPPKGHTSHP